MKINLIFLLVIFQLTATSQQEIHVVADDGIAISDVKILVRILPSLNTSIYFTNADGIIVIGSSDSLQETEIRLSRIGYNALCDTIFPGGKNLLVLKRNTTFDPVCVTTQYNKTTVNNAIQKITIITADQIQQSGSVNLGDIITYQTGIRISQDNILGSSVNLGGISGENIKILIDGVPVIGRLNGSVDLSQINLNNIERIEIIEGPLSVNYGTNALGGTINLITKNQKELGVKVELNPYFENTGYYNFNFVTGFQFKKNAFSISGGRNYFDGWSSHQNFFDLPKEQIADTNRFLTWKPKEQYFAEIRYQQAIGGWQLNPYFRYFEEKITNRGFPKAPYFETAFDDYYYTWRADAGILIDKQFKAHKLNSIIAFNNFERIKNTYLNDLTTLNKVLSETTGAQDTASFYLFNIRATFNSVSTKKINYEIGLDLNQESAYGARIENQKQLMGDYAAFVTSEWQPIKNLLIKPGIRYGYNTVYKAPLVPSLHIKYKLKSITLRASVAKGFRAPSLKELYFDFVDINHNIHGNKNLLAENSMNYNASIGWMHQTDKNVLFKIDFSSYFNDIQNLITLGLDGSNSYTYINIGDYKTIGNQLNFSVRHKKISVQLNTSYIGRYNAITIETSVKPFTYSPEIGSQISYTFLKEKLTLNVFYKYNGSLQSFYLDAKDEIVGSTQKPFQILDVTFSLKMLKNKLTFTGGAKNILNVTTVAVSGQTSGVHSGDSNLNMARGFSVFLGINYQLNFKFKQDEK